VLTDRRHNKNNRNYHSNNNQHGTGEGDDAGKSGANNKGEKANSTGREGKRGSTGRGSNGKRCRTCSKGGGGDTVRTAGASRPEPVRPMLPGNSMALLLNPPEALLRYHSVLAEFMSYRDGSTYEKTYPFPGDKLLKITPDEVAKWMAYKVYGVEFPGPSDRPAEGGASSMMFFKKAISYFMPNRLM
jgi:hypothetical protein